MEYNIEHEPLPIELKRPELELAWRGLLYSVEAGYLTKGEAVDRLKEWDGSEVKIDHDSDIIRVDE